LLNKPFCRLIAACEVDPVSEIPLRALGIRVYLNREVIRANYESTKLTDTNALTFECFLSRCLREPYIIEKFSKMKDIFMTSFITPLNNGEELYWCFQENAFTLKKGPSIKFNNQQCYVVSTTTDHWQETVLLQTLQLSTRRKIETTLILTDCPKKWTDLCIKLGVSCALLKASKINLNDNFNASNDLNDSNDSNDLNNLNASNASNSSSNADLNADANEDVQVLVGTRDSLIYNRNVYFSLKEDVKFALQIAAPGHRTEAQIERFIRNNLVPKFTNFNKSLAQKVFGACILDNVDIQEKLDVKKYIKIIHSNHTTKPNSITFDQAKSMIQTNSILSRFDLLAPVEPNLPHFMLSFDPTYLSVPKNILKRFHIFGHPIKVGSSEDRISKIFKNCNSPLSYEMTIERFSARPMPSSVAKDFIKKHFERTDISLACFIEGNGQSFPLCKGFIDEAFDLPKVCSICSEEESVYTFSFCGHIYCKDCSKQYFSSQFMANNSKECAVCRTPLCAGDVFQIDEKINYEPFLPSKEYAIQSFTKALKSPKHVKIWPSETLSKYICVQNIEDVSSKDFIQLLDDHKNVNIHVFYLHKESWHFQKFLQEFQ
jgi:hypothetical protein